MNIPPFFCGMDSYWIGHVPVSTRPEAEPFEPLRDSANEDVCDPKAQGSKTLQYNRLKVYVTKD